jgi:hypothetical protein
MTPDEINAVVEEMSGIAAILRAADPTEPQFRHPHGRRSLPGPAGRMASWMFLLPLR